MDILKPKLVWVDGRCYRQLPVKDSEIQLDEEENFNEPMKPQRQRDDDYENTDLPVKHQGDKFFIVKTVPKELIKFIVGGKGATKSQIENSTSANLNIPSPRDISKDDDEADISITGESVSSVVRAYQRIENIVEDVRWRTLEHTHFISVPMNNENIVEKYLYFKNDVLRTCRGSRGVSENIFQSPASLHVTIAMLTLLTKREKEEAKAMLQQTKDQINHLLEKPLQIEIKGVEYMNDEPEEVRILYGKVQEKDDNRLQIIANKLADIFSKSPLGKKEMSDDPNNVKLHVTLMRGKPGARGYTEPFDATQILEKYADYSFGQTTLSEIHISIRYTAEKNSYYKPLYVLEL